MESFTNDSLNSAEANTEKYDFELITPLFGGSSKKWELDEDCPISEKGIKGQLRFWWRTMQTEINSNALLEEENKLFGGRTTHRGEKISLKSPIKISINFDYNSIEKKIITKGDNGNYDNDKCDIPTYLLFPIESILKSNSVSYIKKCNFELIVTYSAGLSDKMREAFRKVLELWCLFGGVGARTRRGLGSLYCKELMEGFNSIDDILKFVEDFGCLREAGEASEEMHEAEYPQLNKVLLRLIILGNNNNSFELWKNYLIKYGEYRQGAGIGRSTGYGRSFWPEPDSFRVITKCHSSSHKHNHPPEHSDVKDSTGEAKKKWFPRAAYGLPIITMFTTKGDPCCRDSIKLRPEGEGFERWPSPVIMKVIKLGNGDVVKCCLILNSKIPDLEIEFPCEIDNPSQGMHNSSVYKVKSTEMPLVVSEKTMETMKIMKDSPDHCLDSDEDPYTHLLRKMDF